MFSSKLQAHWQVWRQIGLGLLLIVAVGLSGWAQSAPTAPKSKKQKPKAAKAAEPAPPEATAPTPPPPPPTPEQMPARPPTVSYQNGQLSIIAPNSTLSDILQAVKSKTGAAIDIPPGANERVVSRFGPGPARDVLAALLNGSHFNYVMIGSDANPTSVAQVILTPRVGGETPAVNQANGAVPNPGMPQYPGQAMQPQPPGGQPVYQPAPGVAAQGDEPAADSEQDDSAAQQDDANGTDQGAPEQVNQGADGQDGNAQPPQVKTPEQLLQELQRQQQIQQQQQQGQPAPNPAPPR